MADLNLIHSRKKDLSFNRILGNSIKKGELVVPGLEKPAHLCRNQFFRILKFFTWFPLETWTKYKPEGKLPISIG